MNLFYLAALGAAIGSVDAKLSNFAIQESCGQTGEEPLGASGVPLKERLPGGDETFTFNYQCYQPSEKVKQYAPDTPAPKNLFDMEDEGTEYITDIVMSCLAPIIIGIIGFAIFLVWSCATLRCCAGESKETGCCFGKCCGEPFLWSKMVKRIVALVGFTFGIAMFVIAMRGSAVNKTMNDSIDGLAGSFSLLEDWAQSAVDEMYTQDKAYTVFKEKADAFVKLVEEKGTKYNDAASPDCAEMSGSKAGYVEGSAETGFYTPNGCSGSSWVEGNVEIVKAVGEGMKVMMTDLTDMTTSIADIGIAEALGDINDTRHTLVVGLWVCLAIFTVATMVNIALSQLAPECMVNKPAKLGFGCLTLLMVTILLLLFVFAGGLKILTVTMAGFCLDPDTLMKAEVAEGEPFGYYLDCDTAAATGTIPYKKDTDKVMQALYVASDQYDKLHKTMEADFLSEDSMSGPASLDYLAFYDDAKATHEAMVDFMTAIGGAGGDRMSKRYAPLVCSNDADKYKRLPSVVGTKADCTAAVAAMFDLGDGDDDWDADQIAECHETDEGVFVLKYPSDKKCTEVLEVIEGADDDEVAFWGSFDLSCDSEKFWLSLTTGQCEEFVEHLNAEINDSITDDIERCQPRKGSDLPGGWGDKSACQFGTEVDSGQGFTSGAFSSMQCYEANARYQAFINTLCVDFQTSVATTYELLLGAGICMIFMEWARRLVRSPQDWKELRIRNSKVMPMEQLA